MYLLGRGCGKHLMLDVAMNKNVSCGHTVGVALRGGLMLALPPDGLEDLHALRNVRVRRCLNSARMKTAYSTGSRIRGGQHAGHVELKSWEPDGGCKPDANEMRDPA